MWSNAAGMVCGWLDIELLGFYCYRRWQRQFAAGLTKQVLGRLAY